MQLWHWLSGSIDAELTSADISGFLSAAQLLQIELQQIERSDHLKIRFLVHRHDWKAIQLLTQKRGEKLIIKHHVGMQWQLARLRHRPALALGILLLLLVSAWVPRRVLFIRVEGNATIPTKQIVEAAIRSGIGFGASRREVRSERTKNALLDAIPQLSWAGVNTYGCTAVISVKERAQEQSHLLPNTVSSIVAARDGVISQMTVIRGNSQCVVGQVVKQGQVLISGYNDCGLCIQATNAQGEIFAQTKRTIRAVGPTVFRIRREKTCTEAKYSLIIGNKRINFANNSGISGAGCAKIYKENYVILPGGFSLPLALCVETFVYYETQDVQFEAVAENLPDFSSQYLLEQMNAGSILRMDVRSEIFDDIAVMHGIYSCNEMIGISRIEENILDYVENG